MKRGIIMQINYAKNVKANINLKNNKELRAAILGIVQNAIKLNHLDFTLVGNSYNNESIQLIFRNITSSSANSILVLTNYRILYINQSTLDNILHGNVLNEQNIEKNILFVDLTSCQDNIYQGEYSLILQYENDRKFTIYSEARSDSNFIKREIKPIILRNNEQMVEAYNRSIEKDGNIPLDISSVVIDPNEKTIQEVIDDEQRREHEAEEKEKSNKIKPVFSIQEHKNITKEKDDSTVPMSRSDESKNNSSKKTRCQVAFGPAPSGYHQIDVVYVQGPTINWISNNGNFPKAMGKALSMLLDMLQPDEFVCNLQFTTQNMGDTFAVNLAGDLYKKD